MRRTLIIISHIFKTDRKLQKLFFQMHKSNFHNLTVSAVHIKDFLKKLSLLETPMFAKTS